MLCPSARDWASNSPSRICCAEGGGLQAQTSIPTRHIDFSTGPYFFDALGIQALSGSIAPWLQGTPAAAIILKWWLCWLSDSRDAVHTRHQQQDPAFQCLERCQSTGLDLGRLSSPFLVVAFSPITDNDPCSVSAATLYAKRSLKMAHKRQPMHSPDLPKYPAVPTRWEFDGAGIEFRLWTQPVLEQDTAVPMTLTWRHLDGTAGKRGCSGIVEATEYASRVVVLAGMGERLTD